MAPKKVADKTSSPQRTDKPVKKKEKKVKVEKPQLKTPSIIKLKISSLNKKLPCKPSEPPIKLTAKESKAIDAAARKIELANEVAMAQFSRPDEPSVLAEFNSAPPAKYKPIKVTIKKPKKPSDKPDKPKKGRPKKAVSEFFKTSTPVGEKPDGTNDEPNSKVQAQAVVNKSPAKKRIRKKKVNPDFQKFDTTSDSFEGVPEPKKKSKKKSTTTKKPSKPKIPKVNKKKTDCVSKPRIRKPFQLKGKLTAETIAEDGFPSLLDNNNKMETAKLVEKEISKEPARPKCPSKILSRETSVSSERLSWAKDISSSSSATCVTVASNDIVKLDNRLPIVQLTNIENFLKPDVEKYGSESESTSSDSIIKCSVTNSLSNSVSLNLSCSSSSTSATSPTKPSNSNTPTKEYIDDFDPTKLIDLEFLKNLAQGNFELNQRDRALMNDPEWPEAEREIMQCCQDIKRILCSDFLNDDEDVDLEPIQEPEKKTYESAKNLEANENTSENNDKKLEANSRTFENGNFDDMTDSNCNINDNIDKNLEPVEITFEQEYRNYEQDINAMETGSENLKYNNYNTKEDSGPKQLKVHNAMETELQKTYDSKDYCVPKQMYEPLQRNSTRDDVVSKQRTYEPSQRTIIDYCVPKQRYELLQRNSTIDDVVPKQSTYEPLQRTINNDINRPQNIENDNAHAEKETQDFDNTFEDPFQSSENHDKRETYRQQNDKDYAHAEKETQDFDNTFEDPLQTSENHDKSERYRQQINKDYAHAEKETQDFDNTFEDPLQTSENHDKSERYRQQINKDHAHAEKETQDFDNTFEAPFQSPGNDDKREWYRQQNNNVVDDDDVLSLMAESLTGLDSSRITNSSVCAKAPDAEEYIPQQAPRPLMSINCKPVRTENSTKVMRNNRNDFRSVHREIHFEDRQNNNNFQQNCPENRNDFRSLHREIHFEDRQNNNNFQQNCPENQVQKNAENQVPFQQTFLNQRPTMLLATLYTVPSPTKCHFLRGVCYFNLLAHCRRTQCRFPHRSVDAVEALNRMSSCDNITLIGDYMLIRNSPDLRRKFGHCFACEFERRRMTRVLVEMVIDFTCRARADSSEDYNLRIVITDKTLKHLNEVDLNTCADLLTYLMATNYLLCDKLMDEIAGTQNFSRFKLIFLKLTDFMVSIFRMFSFSVASQILERVCILPCEPALIRAVWLIVMSTDDRIFRNPHMQQFEHLVCNWNPALYERFMTKKRQVFTDREMITGVPNSQEGDQNLAVMEQEKRYMATNAEMDNSKQSDNQNLKPPQVQQVTRKGVFTFTAPKTPNFKIPSTSRQTSLEYRSPLQASGTFSTYRGNQRGFQQSTKKGPYKGPTKFPRRPGPSDY